MDSIKNLSNKFFNLLKRPHYKIALIYLVISFLWIVYSDKIAYEAFSSLQSFKYIQSVKGLFFIIATSLLIFLLIRNDYRTIKEKNNQLNDSKIKMQLAFDSSNIGTYEFDIENDLVYFDEKSQEIFGVKKSKLKSQEILNQIHPNDLQMATETLEKAIRTENETKFFATYRIIRNNEIRWIDSTIIMYTNEDKKSLKNKWGIGTFLDFTEKKKSTEQLNIFMHVIENAKIGIFRIDSLGKVQYVNMEVCKNLGYSKEELLSLTIFDIDRNISKENFFSRRSNIEETIKKPLITTHTRKDGSTYPVEINLSYFTFDNKQFVFSFAKDISDSKNAENELKQTQNQLRALFTNIDNIREEERKTLARELHDELGQVLTSLNMNLSLLKNNIEKNLFDNHQLISELNEMSQIIDEAKVNMKKLIRSLRPEYLDNLGLIPAINHLIEEHKKNKKIKINFIQNCEEINFESQKENIVYRVVQESLTNIIKHAQASNVEVELTLDYNKLLVKISDDGIGISSEDFNKENSFGIIGMKERLSQIGSNLIIKRKENSGTILSFEITL